MSGQNHLIIGQLMEKKKIQAIDLSPPPPSHETGPVRLW